MKQAGQKSVKEELPKQRKGPKRTEECRLKVPTHIWEQDAGSSSLPTRTNLDKPRFSNCFTEKRGSSIVVRCFSFFVAPDLFFKIFQKKQYLYIGQRFREHSPIKQACKHFQMPVVSYNSAFGEAALYCRTELIFYASAEMLFSCIVLPVGFLPLE